MVNDRAKSCASARLVKSRSFTASRSSSEKAAASPVSPASCQAAWSAPGGGTSSSKRGTPPGRRRQQCLYFLPLPQGQGSLRPGVCLLYTSDAADDLLCVDLGGRRI